MNAQANERECRLSDELTRALFERFPSPDALKNKSRALKRALTTLRKQVADIEPLMDEEERAAYRRSLEVIDRWTGKAERAFKERDRIRKATEAHRESRRQTARDLLEKRYPADDWREQIRLGHAYHATSGLGFGSYTDDLLSRLRWSAKHFSDPLKAIRRAIREHYTEQLRDVVGGTIYPDEKPVEELVEYEAQRIDAACEAGKDICAACISEIEQLIARKTLETANPNAGQGKR